LLIGQLNRETFVRLRMIESPDDRYSYIGIDIIGIDRSPIDACIAFPRVSETVREINKKFFLESV
jgi:hypothetical protein